MISLALTICSFKAVIRDHSIQKDNSKMSIEVSMILAVAVIPPSHEVKRGGGEVT